MTKIVSVADLIARKQNKKTEKRARLFIPSIGGEIEIKAPDHALTSELISKAQTLESSEADSFAVYQCVVNPNLRDTELQKAYECTEPMDIVKHTFLPGEIAEISSQIMKLSGFNNGVKLVDDIKK